MSRRRERRCIIKKTKCLIVYDGESSFYLWIQYFYYVSIYSVYIYKRTMKATYLEKVKMCYNLEWIMFLGRGSVQDTKCTQLNRVRKD